MRTARQLHIVRGYSSLRHSSGELHRPPRWFGSSRRSGGGGFRLRDPFLDVLQELRDALEDGRPVRIRTAGRQLVVSIRDAVFGQARQVNPNCRDGRSSGCQELLHDRRVVGPRIDLTQEGQPGLQLFLAGECYQRLGRAAEARAALERLVSEEDRPHYRSVDVGLRTYRGRQQLALLYRALGVLEHAERVLREVASTWPDYLPARVSRAETLVLMDRKKEARAVLAGIPAVPGIQEGLEAVWRLLDGA